MNSQSTFLFTVFFTACLAACGGGNESTGALSSNNGAPVTSAQSDASTLTKSAVDAANSSAQFASTSAAFAMQSPDPTTKSVVPKLISQTVNCASSSQLSGYCVGQATVNSNLSVLGASSAGVAAGTYLNIQFAGFRLLTAPVDQATTGSVALVFVDAFTSPTLLNGIATIRVDITAPKPEVHTDLKLTFKQLSAVTSSNGVTLNGGASVSSATQPTSDVVFNAWRTIGATPQAGSLATIKSGNESTTVQVVSVVGTQVTFDVIVSVNGVAQPTKRVVMDIVNGLPVYRII